MKLLTELYYTVLSEVNMEAEAGMTMHGQHSQFKSAHCTKVCKVCVFIDGSRQLLVTARVSLLVDPGAACL